LFVFAGVASAFALHVVLAVGAGSLLLLLPHRVVEAVVAVLFAAGAVLMLRRREEAPPEAAEGPGDADPDGGPSAAAGPGGVATLARSAVRARDGFWRVAVRSFAVLFVAEFGDLTQLATVNLAARYHDPSASGWARCWACGRSARWPSPGGQPLRVVRSSGLPAPPRPS
jgi:putative Ca2+/H+ antiporter (TMEM165/GDT1 family)